MTKYRGVDTRFDPNKDYRLVIYADGKPQFPVDEFAKEQNLKNYSHAMHCAGDIVEVLYEVPMRGETLGHDRIVYISTSHEKQFVFYKGGLSSAPLTENEFYLALQAYYDKWEKIEETRGRK